MFLELKGKRALFARHELKIERYSYDVPTPSALQGVLKSVYWKPEMDYIIKKIYVLNKPQFEMIVSNAQSKAQDFGLLEKALEKGDTVSFSRDDNATPRSMNVLNNVHYVVEFEIVLTGKGTSPDDSVNKHSAIFKRRVEKGQYFRLPCLGISEFPCEYNLIDEKDIPRSEVKGICELGVMLHHIDYSGDMPKPVFYKPVMRDGVIDVNESSDSDRGWLFAELCRLYDRVCEKYQLPVLGYSAEKITYEAVLNKEGKMIRLSPLSISDKGKIKPVILTVPEMVKGRTSGIKANFIYDNASYVFGINDERGNEKRQAFVKKIEDVVRNQNEEITILLKFLKDFDYNDYEYLLESYNTKKGIDIVGNIVFRIDGEDHYVHETESVKAQWMDYYKDSLPDVTGTCAVTGKQEKITDMHPIIKGVINSSSFTKLVSVNSANTAFNSYGWYGIENSAMGVSATFKYSTALNWLLQQVEHRVSVDNSTFVFWTENDNDSITEILKYLLLGLKKDDADYDYSILDTEEKIYIAEIKANSSRLCIAGFWCIDSINDLYDFTISKLYKRSNITKYWDYLLEWKGLISMNKDCVAYRLGELFAILEKAQRDAVKSTRENVTIADKYLEKASMTPAAIFPRLLENSTHHTNKVDYGSRRMIAQKMSELEVFDMPFPNRLENEERCVFFMGYYQKRDAMIKEIKEKANQKNEHKEQEQTK